MKVTFGRLISSAGLAVALGSGSAHAQDFFRDYGSSRSSAGFGPVMPSEYSYEESSPSGLRPLVPLDESEEADKYNFAIGPVRFSMAAGFGVEFNDNITLSDDDRQSDVILRPFVGIDAAWRMSELNTLRFSLGASYAKYLDHSEYDSDGVLLSPTSEIAFTFQLGVVKVTLRDRFSYQEDAYDVPQLSQVARYRRYENQAGIQLDWAINQNLALAGGYDHYNLWTLDEEFADQERSIDTVYIRPSYQLTPAIKVGLNAALSFVNFDTEDRQDATNLLVGPFIEWQISDFTNVYFEAGFQQLKYDGVSVYDNDFVRNLDDDERALFEDTDDGSSYYVKFEINNRPTESFTHRLSGSKTTEIGFASNYYDLYHVEYTADWGIIRDTQFGPTLFWEYYESSGDNPEEAHRFGAALGIRHNLTNSLTLGLDYRFLIKNSNVEDADYYQNLAFLSLYYKF
jgi:hypothetical protein